MTTYRVTLLGPDGTRIAFDCEEGRTIVRAARNAGYELMTGCLQGRCAICRARLVEGEVRAIRRRSKHATADPANRPDGCVLQCSVGPVTDVVVAPLAGWRTLEESV